jgi:hypothetical protein
MRPFYPLVQMSTLITDCLEQLEALRITALGGDITDQGTLRALTSLSYLTIM